MMVIVPTDITCKYHQAEIDMCNKILPINGFHVSLFYSIDCKMDFFLSFIAFHHN